MLKTKDDALGRSGGLMEKVLLGVWKRGGRRWMKRPAAEVR